MISFSGQHTRRRVYFSKMIVKILTLSIKGITKQNLTHENRELKQQTKDTEPETSVEVETKSSAPRQVCK